MVVEGAHRFLPGKLWDCVGKRWRLRGFPCRNQSSSSIKKSDNMASLYEPVKQPKKVAYRIANLFMAYSRSNTPILYASFTECADWQNFAKSISIKFSSLFNYKRFARAALDLFNFHTVTASRTDSFESSIIASVTTFFGHGRLIILFIVNWQTMIVL